MGDKIVFIIFQPHISPPWEYINMFYRYILNDICTIFSQYNFLPVILFDLFVYMRVCSSKEQGITSHWMMYLKEFFRCQSIVLIWHPLLVSLLSCTSSSQVLLLYIWEQQTLIMGRFSIREFDHSWVPNLPSWDGPPGSYEPNWSCTLVGSRGFSEATHSLWMTEMTEMTWKHTTWFPDLCGNRKWLFIASYCIMRHCGPKKILWTWLEPNPTPNFRVALKSIDFNIYGFPFSHGFLEWNPLI